MIRPISIAGALVLSGLLQTSLVCANEGPSRTLPIEDQVQALEQKAQQAQLSKDNESARGLRLQAFLLQANSNTALELGRTELELKRYRDSAEHLDYAVRTLPEGTSERTRALAKRALAEAKAQIAVVRATTNHPGAEIRVDGRSIGKAPLASPIYLEPGTHEISAHFENNAITRPVVVVSGQEYQLTLPLVSRSAASSRKRTTPIAASVQTTRLSTNSLPEPSRSPVPLLVGGTVFVAGLAAGIVFWLDSTTKYQTADEMRARRATSGCVGELSRTDECAALLSATESADRSRDWSTVGFAAAGAALVGTVVYWYWPWAGENPRQTARFQLAPLVSGSTSGLMLRGGF